VREMGSGLNLTEIQGDAGQIQKAIEVGTCREAVPLPTREESGKGGAMTIPRKNDFFT